MPAKSRRQRKKHSAQSQKRKGSPSPAGLLVSPPVTAPAKEPAPPAKTAVPAINTPAPAAKPVTVSHTYIAKELLTIGILAVIMLAILIVLALVWPS